MRVKKLTKSCSTTYSAHVLRSKRYSWMRRLSLMGIRCFTFHANYTHSYSRSICWEWVLMKRSRMRRTRLPRKLLMKRLNTRRDLLTLVLKTYLLRDWTSSGLCLWECDDLTLLFINNHLPKNLAIESMWLPCFSLTLNAFSRLLISPSSSLFRSASYRASLSYLWSTIYISSRKSPI